MLREGIKKFSNPYYNGTGTAGVNNNTNTHPDAVNNMLNEGASVEIKKFNKIQNDYIIFNDNTKARIIQFIPGLKWKTTSKPDDKGVINLFKPLEATVLKVGGKRFVLGVKGESREFEYYLRSGDNEIRLNKNYISIDADHVVIKKKERFK